MPPLSDHIVGRNALLYLVGLLFLTAICYAAVWDHQFVNWDDPVYVTENPYVQSLNWSNFKAIWTEGIASNYHPITMLSLALDNVIGGGGPRVFHLTNVFLHLLNTILVFLFVFSLFRQTRFGLSLCVAALFALHPMHVEAVAWVTSRKELLFTTFYLAGLMSYLRYLRQDQLKWLGLAFLTALLSLLSKPSAITFFAVLFLIDYWEKRPFTSRALFDKLPFFLAALPIIFITFELQAGSSLKTFGDISIWQRIQFGSYGMLMYLLKSVIPFGFNPFHSYPNLAVVPTHFAFMPVLLGSVLGGWVFYCLRSKNRLGLFGMGFFLLTLAPTTQFVSFGEALLSERYTYLPYVGLFLIVGQALSWMAQKSSEYRQLVAFGLGFYLAILAFQTRDQVKVWKNGIQLWSSSVENAIYPNYRNYTNLGNAYAFAGAYEPALEAFQQAIIYYPGNFDAHCNTGLIYYRQNKPEQALAAFNHALRLQPGHYNALANRGHVYFKQERWSEALADYMASLQANPNQAEIFQMSGIIQYLHLDQLEKGLADINQAIALDPSRPLPYLHRSKIYLKRQQTELAKRDVKIAQTLGYEVSPQYLTEVEQSM